LKLPNGDRAIVPEAKLRDYCLNVEHSVGGEKARVFVAPWFERHGSLAPDRLFPALFPAMF